MNVFIIFGILIIFMIILIYLSGWFSGTETALTNITAADIAEMRKNHEKNVDYISKTKRDMDRTLVTILIGNNVVNIVLSSIAAIVANELFQEIGVTIMVFIITFLIIIFGEITPKSNAIWDTRKVAQRNAKRIHYLGRVLGPFVTMFMWISRGIIKLTGKKIEKKNMLISDESIKSLATLGEEEGVIKKIERDIIHNVFTFGDRKIQDIMVPMKDVFYLQKKVDIPKASELVAKHGFTRIPVMNKNKEVIGVLYSKELVDRETGPIDPIMKSPFIVQAENEISDVFSEMRQKRIHLAIVKDKSGKHIGIVTLEDILEELVGEIYDEYFDVKYKDIIGNNQSKADA